MPATVDPLLGLDRIPSIPSELIVPQFLEFVPALVPSYLLHTTLPGARVPSAFGRILQVAGCEIELVPILEADDLASGTFSDKMSAQPAYEP
jgi:hypothetical protein